MDIGIIIAIISGIFLIVSGYSTIPLGIRQRKQEIRQKQYDSFFVPVHRLLFFKSIKYKDKSQKEKLEIIDKLIYKNYGQLPNDLKEEYQHCIEEKEITEKFQNDINFYYEKLRGFLGYYSSFIQFLVYLVYVLAVIGFILIFLSGALAIGSYINPDWSLLSIRKTVYAALTVVLVIYLVLVIIVYVKDKKSEI